MSDNVLNDVSINSFSSDLSVSDTVNEGEVIVKNGHSPYIGQNGNWYEYDDQNEEYTDTEVKAEGPQGPTGPAGQDGSDGQDGADGSDYVLTAQDKADIAALVAQLIPEAEGSGF